MNSYKMKYLKRDSTGRNCAVTRKNGAFVNTSDGKRVSKRDAAYLRKLRIPPKYRNVCILPKSKNIGVKATAIDGKNKLQYFYDNKHRKIMREKKYDRVGKLAGMVKKLEREFRSLMNSEDRKERAVGLAYMMMLHCGIRPGKKSGVRNKTFGATTIHKKHIKLIPGGVQLNFPGKKRVKHNCKIMDSEFRRAMQLALDDGTYFRNNGPGIDIWHPRVLPKGIKPKDLRTLSVNRFLLELCKHDKSKTKPTKRIGQLIKKTAERIGHTPKVCRAAYLSRDVVSHGEEMLSKKIKSKMSVYDDIHRLLA